MGTLVPEMVSGATSAAFGGLWIHDAVGLFVTPLVLAILYFVIPAASGRPIYSHFLSMLGFATFAAIGGIVHAWQRLPGARYNPRTIQWAFWLLTAGISVMVIDLTLAGLIQGHLWQQAEPWMESVQRRGTARPTDLCARGLCLLPHPADPLPGR